jgi:signal transduction histidine kinase
VDEGDWNEVDLNPGIESSINIIKGYARKKGVQIKMNLGALPVIRCRAARIHQVIVNLLTNAIDACAAPNGMVTVSTHSEPEPMGIRIDVEDNGCGIDAVHRERIFDPFYTTKPIGQGTGLGLSISYGIIQEHGGRIEVQSEPGGGSRFTIHIPLEPTAGHAESNDLSRVDRPEGEATPTPALVEARPLPDVVRTDTNMAPLAKVSPKASNEALP